jgi:hypothetical protein
MRVRVSVVGLLPVGLATAFVATFLAACGGGGGGGGVTTPPLSDNDLITRSAQQGSSTTGGTAQYVRQFLRGLSSSTGPLSRGRQVGQCPRVVITDARGELQIGSFYYIDELIGTVDYGNGCVDQYGDYGRGSATIRMTNVVMYLPAFAPGNRPQFGEQYRFETAEIQSTRGFAWSPSMRPVTGNILISIDYYDNIVHKIFIEYDLSTRYSSICVERVLFEGVMRTNSFLNWLFDDVFVRVEGRGDYYSPLTGTISFDVDYFFRFSDECPYPSAGEELLRFRDGNTARVSYNISQGCGIATLAIDNVNNITINLNNLAGITPCR